MWHTLCPSPPSTVQFQPPPHGGSRCHEHPTASPWLCSRRHLSCSDCAVRVKNHPESMSAGPHRPLASRKGNRSATCPDGNVTVTRKAKREVRWSSGSAG
ncbi:hypothetical protein CRG98_043404 [Punica granatum]|uniref:Uncharacterized protein n=1 Tax=Punica granatum TaxID=22663 RepID=A0A2I0HWY7_PUNGR|nr:hypothetical protein CRG98_043404 [Punica granatum]